MIKNEKVKDITHAIFPFILSYGCAVIITRYVNMVEFKIVQGDFMIQFLGLFLGIIIALLSFALSITDKIKENLLNNTRISDIAREKQFQGISEIIEELKHDTEAIFWFFIIIIGVYILENLDIPSISWPIKEWFSKQAIINQIKITIFIVTLYAIYDVMEIIFRLSDVTGLVPKKNNKVGTPNKAHEPDCTGARGMFRGE